MFWQLRLQDMRWTSFFSPTLRDAPADAEATSHKLLVRAGFIRQLHSGHYTLLPLAFKVRKKIIQIIEEQAIGKVAAKEI